MRRRRIHWNNNKEDWDCGVQAINNLMKISGTHRQVDYRDSGITKKDGVVHFKKYRKSIRKHTKVKQMKAMANPRLADLMGWLNSDKPAGKTQNVAVLYTKDRGEKYGHMSLAYEVDGDKVRIANLVDEKPSSAVNPRKISNKKTRIKSAYLLKVEKNKVLQK